MSKWKVSREEEYSVFTYSAMDKDRGLKMFFRDRGCVMSMVDRECVVHCPEESESLFLVEMELRGYNLERHE